MAIIRRYLPKLVGVLFINFLLLGLLMKLKDHGDQSVTVVKLVAPGMKLYFHRTLLANNTRQLDNPRSLQQSLTERTKPVCKAHQSLVFLKTHKSGSTTIIAILQKYAYVKNLLVMVPNIENAMFNWPVEFRPNIDNVRAENNQRFDMLVNHVIFNKTSIATVMKADVKYVTILRDPLAHLRSAFNYFELNEHNRLGNGSDAFKLYLSNPNRYDMMPKWLDDVLPLATNRINSLTRNLQSADLGLSYWNFDDNLLVSEFLQQTLADFDFIIILERLEESLVLVRRLLCWRMQDIMFIPKNVSPDHSFELLDLPELTRENAYKWNNVDLLLYQAASKRLDELRSLHEDLDEEIAVFKQRQLQMRKFCLTPQPSITTSNTLVIEASRWNEEFTIDNRFCALMLFDERDLTLAFKCKQHPRHRECQGRLRHRLKAMKDMIASNSQLKYFSKTES